MSISLNYYKTHRSQFKARSSALPLNKREVKRSGELGCEVQDDAIPSVTSDSLIFPKSNSEVSLLYHGYNRSIPLRKLGNSQPFCIKKTDTDAQFPLQS